MSLIKKQIEIEERYSRKNIRSWIKEELMASEEMMYAMSLAFGTILEYLNGDYYPSKNLRYSQFKQFNELEDIMLEVMIEVLQLPDGRGTFQRVAGKVSTYIRGMTYLDSVKTASDIMGLMCHADLFDVIQPAMTEEGVLMIESIMVLDEVMLQRIANTKYLPPMIVPVQTVLANKGYQYYTKQTPLIKKGFNMHDGYLAYDVINSLGTMKLTLDTEVVFNELEKSKKPLDTPEKFENFRRMMLASKATYIETIELGNEFYIPWSYDKRGRVYCDGYHINYQSTEYKKALIDLPPLMVTE